MPDRSRCGQSARGVVCECTCLFRTVIRFAGRKNVRNLLACWQLLIWSREAIDRHKLGSVGFLQEPSCSCFLFDHDRCFRLTATASRAQRPKLRLQSPMRYRSLAASSGSESPFAGHFHYVARSPRVSGSTITRLSTSMGRGAGQPTLKWERQARLPRLASSGYTTPRPARINSPARGPTT